MQSGRAGTGSVPTVNRGSTRPLPPDTALVNGVNKTSIMFNLFDIPVSESSDSNAPVDEDLELLDRHASGDREAFNDLVRKYQRPLYAMLYRMVSNQADAADLLQKT